MYLVIAFRWGWTNNHWYIVYGGSDRTKACAMATTEANDRGGKYGCAVFEFNSDGCEHKMISYASSANAETEPEHNERLEYFSRLGQFMDNYASGSVLLPDPANPPYLKYTEVIAPQIVKDEVTRQRRLLEAWQTAKAEHDLKTAASESPPAL